jgi:hypothetical protein
MDDAQCQRGLACKTLAEMLAAASRRARATRTFRPPLAEDAAVAGVAQPQHGMASTEPHTGGRCR